MSRLFTGAPTFLKVLGLLFLFAVSVTVFMGKSYERSLQAMDSAVYARLALDSSREPGLPAPPLSPESKGGHFGEAGFNDHPFPFIWLNGKVMRALDRYDAFSARLLPTLLSVGCVFLVFLLGVQILGFYFRGWLAALVLALTPQFISYGSRFHLDTPFIFLMLLSFLFWVRGGALLAGIAAGLSLWVKPPMGILLLPCAGLAALITGEVRTREFWKRILLATGMTFLLGALYWVLVAKLSGFELVRDYWVRYFYGTIVESRGQGPTPTLPILVKGILLRYLPFFIALCFSLVMLYRSKSWRNRHLLLVAMAPLVVLAIFLAIRFKYEHYFLPAYPFLALLIAAGLGPWLERHEERILKGAVAFGLVVFPLLIALPIDFGSEKFPQLKLLTPYIQRTGECSDRMLFVDGSAPYGDAGDYRSELMFYANRRSYPATCATLAEDVRRREAKWIFTNLQQFESCVPSEVKEAFPFRYQVGNQLLLSVYSIQKEGEPLDLTPLVLENRAMPDCDPLRLEANRYLKLPGEG